MRMTHESKSTAPPSEENNDAQTGEFIESGFRGGPGCLDGSQSKTMRARTPFKPEQIRIMKDHFLKNRYPSSRELKDLYQNTGLDVCKNKVVRI